MITIDQLLESVDLDFEPRWVTKNEDGVIRIWKHTPFIAPSFGHWNGDCSNTGKRFGRIKLAEFDGKDWTECLYEVPRKTTGKIENFTIFDFEKINKVVDKLNMLVDAVNELKGAKND